VNAYEVKAGMVCLQCKNCDPCLSASVASFLRWGAIQYIYYDLPCCVSDQAVQIGTSY